MTKEFMLIDTLRYYHKHPRCANYGRCLYSSKTLDLKGTVGCAIGRFMTPKNRLKADSCNKGIIDLLRNEAHLFPKKLHNLGEDFLNACQSLHDNGINWGI